MNDGTTSDFLIIAELRKALEAQRQEIERLREALEFYAKAGQGKRARAPVGEHQPTHWQPLPEPPTGEEKE